ncbi:ABC transporter substrate-binding protein [Streptomyces sp. ATCC 21386]|uniref:ABC transporter substrate-binding protein n=1 Tax=Streptomyces sp. ATCC 21386 TaxID=2699428 RepID=UPI001BFFC0A4|nr:ABC transporter substrate-binding protein [Streptomyces sp. ATCC 21386]
MTAPLDGPGFPNDQATDFVREFQATVAPTYANRAKLGTSPPLFILRVPQASYQGGVNRVVAALTGALSQRVPYAHLPIGTREDSGSVRADPDSGLPSVDAGRQLFRSAPEHMTPDRFPQFHVMCGLVEYIRSNPGRWATTDDMEAALRRDAGELRAQRGGLLAFTRMQGPDDGGGIAGFLAKLSWLSFVQLLPRWLWARRISRTVVRSWLGAERVAQGSKNLFRVMDQVAAIRSMQLMADPADEEALQEFDWLVLRALMEDLSRPVIGRILPGRRRRTCRPVLFVKIPPGGEPGARAAERFLRSLHRAQGTAKPPGPLVIAVGVPSDTLLQELGNPSESTFPDASVRLADHASAGEPPVLVTISERALAARGVPVPPATTRTFRFSRYVPTSIASGVTALALLAVALLLPPVFPAPRDCVGGTASVAESAPAEPIQVDTTGWYEAAVKTIEEQNKRVAQYADQGRTVRTVVSFVSDPPKSDDETRFDGTIPELRGIAMWQQKLNKEAAADDALIPLHVDVRQAGVAFHDAESEAKKLVAEMEQEESVPARERVVGVLAFAQSRNETRAALRVLGEAGIPTIGTTATADEMLSGPATRTYWPSTPFNSREARIEADFAYTENLVAEPGAEDACTPARHAIVIESSVDLYSHSLAGQFISAFKGTHQVFDFNQEGDFGSAPLSGAISQPDADLLARALCDVFEDKPDSVLYWSARAKDFTALINSMDTAGTCTGRDLTVLGGNELTNVAQTGAFANKDWLRLYYSAHRLPADAPGASDRTRQFVAEYDAYVKATTEGTDPWRQDGHSAVSYDAFHVLSQAVREAGLHDPDIDRKSVLLVLGSGIAFDGATGYVSYDGANAPPHDKTLVLLRQSGNHPEAVLACGAYRQDESSETQGPPCTG